MSLKPSNYTSLSPFKAWVQQALPAVYDDSLSYTDLLSKMLKYINDLVSNNNNLITDMTSTIDYINNYFNSTDFISNINNKLDEMAQDGTLSALIQPLFDEYKKQIDDKISQQNSNISSIESEQTLLSNRMNTFAQLPTGSTSGDAELQDIRNWFNGQKSDTAGEAVRGQCNLLNYSIDNLKSYVNLPIEYKEKACITVQGYYNPETLIKGLGYLMYNIPPYIENISLTTLFSESGNITLELLDVNKNSIYKVTSPIVNDPGNAITVNFNVNKKFNTDPIWIQVYSDTVSIGRCECSLNHDIISTSNDYCCYLVNNNWNYAQLYNYVPNITVTGSVQYKNIYVGPEHEYQTIVGAVNKANSDITHAYNIMIEDGTYDLYQELGGNAWYNSITSAKGNMQGLSLRKNVNLIGLGHVKLTLNAPDNLATENNVPNLSVIELYSLNNKIENIEIECKNVRYGIHDETNGGYPNSKRLLKNVTITHNGVYNNTWNAPVSYGCGSSDNSIFEYINCKFNSGWLAHQNINQSLPPNFYANNCYFGGGNYAISLNTSGTCMANITFNNCLIDHMLRVLENSRIWTMYGSGNNDFEYATIGYYDGYFNQLYDKTISSHITNGNINKLKGVGIGASGNITLANNTKNFIGLCATDSNSTHCIVIKHGYVNTYTLNDFADGTLLGINSSGNLVADNNSPIGVCNIIDNIPLIYLF